MEADLSISYDTIQCLMVASWSSEPADDNDADRPSCPSITCCEHGINGMPQNKWIHQHYTQDKHAASAFQHANHKDNTKCILIIDLLEELHPIASFDEVNTRLIATISQTIITLQNLRHHIHPSHYRLAHRAVATLRHMSGRRYHLETLPRAC